MKRMKKYKLPGIKLTSHGDVMNSMGNGVSSTVLALYGDGW